MLLCIDNTQPLVEHERAVNARIMRDKKKNCLHVIVFPPTGTTMLIPLIKETLHFMEHVVFIDFKIL